MDERGGQTSGGGGETGNSRRSGEGEGEVKGKCKDVVWAPTVGLQFKSECGQRLNLILVAKEARPPSYSIIYCPGGAMCPMFNTPWLPYCTSNNSLHGFFKLL